MSTLSWRIRRLTADALPKFVAWETPATGDKMAPFEHPELHLDRVWFSSTFDYYKVGHHDFHTLTHAAVAGKTTTLGIVTINGQNVVSDQVMYAHNLGYVPRYMVAVGGKLIQDFHPVQVLASPARLRTVSFYATTTEIHCLNFGTSEASALPATTVTYELLLFRPANDGYDPALPVFSAKQGILGKGIIKITDKLLRRSDNLDASPFDLNLGPAVDINHGGARWFLSDGTVVNYGTYAGLATAPASIQCAVTE